VPVTPASRRTSYRDHGLVAERTAAAVCSPIFNTWSYLMNVRSSKHLFVVLALAGWAAVPFGAAHAADKAKPLTGSECGAEFSSKDCPHNEGTGSGVPGGGGFGSGSTAPAPAPKTDPFNCGANPQNCLPTQGGKTQAPSTKQGGVSSDPREKAASRLRAQGIRQECERKNRGNAQAIKDCVARFAV
jgi:hypothetical protein